MLVNLFTWLFLSSNQTPTFHYQIRREHNMLKSIFEHSNWLLHLTIPKHFFTSAKVSQYFVRKIKRTRTMEMILKTMKLSFGRSQTYHHCSLWHQPYQPKRHWMHRLNWTHWLQQLHLAISASSTCQPCWIIGSMATLASSASLVSSTSLSATSYQSHWLCQPRWSHRPHGPHWLQWPYWHHWPHWPHWPCQPNWLSWPHHLHQP